MSSRAQDKFEAAYPGFLFVALNLFEHDGQNTGTVFKGGVVLEVKAGHELLVLGVTDNEVDVARDSAGIAGKDSDEFEFASFAGCETGAPALRVVVAVMIGMKDLDLSARYRFATGVQDSGAQEQGFTLVAFPPEGGFGGCERIVVGPGAASRRGLSGDACVRRGELVRQKKGSTGRRGRGSAQTSDPHNWSIAQYAPTDPLSHVQHQAVPRKNASGNERASPVKAVLR